MRLRNQLLLYISIYILIPFLIFASVAIYLVYQSSMQKEKEYFIKNIDNLSMEMSQYLSSVESSLDIFSRNSAIVSSSLNEKRALLKNFYDQMDNVVKTIYLIDQRGQIITLYPEAKEAASLTFKNKPCFLEVKKSKEKLFTGQTTSLLTKKPTSCIAEPLLLSDGRFAGMIGVELSFDKVKENILKKGYSDYSYFLLDGNQNIIVSDQRDLNPHPTFFKNLVNDSSPLQIQEITLNDEKHYVTYSTLKDYPYTIAAFVPEERFLKPVYQLQLQFIIWVIFSIGSVLLLGYVFRKKILDPLEQFAKMTRRITEEVLGDSLSSFNERIEIKNKGELSDLSEHFNQMLHALKLREDRLYQRRLDLIRTTVELLELNDPYTAGHSYRVYEYSSLIASKLGLPKDQIRDIETAAILHDIGKIGISLDILNKPGKLNPNEYKCIKQHPVIGAQVLERIDQFDRVKNAILHHHERFDGNGYPAMLKGEEIPIEARIISVADAFDAMISNRPYRRGMSMEQAFHIIEEESGKQFDSLVVEAFTSVYNQHYDLLKQINMTQEYGLVSYLAN
ncbi:HD domain-containing phosphohydrolase [Tepidibacillus fermentans]|uniref:Putative nucleotidyltransferase with HDIG domain n=1 Tax=Tepidibacillus fermentans TaxID=1281767 RepID=A0A4R3KL13_9BACI|nr:HD domain-containing phosphohydrolase [Tepidibacillus fermentans]TCS83480.1 putative nucleotidyltransferase with HDIG domain [Tepidibacillus fermentans]